MEKRCWKCIEFRKIRCWITLWIYYAPLNSKLQSSKFYSYYNYISKIVKMCTKVWVLYVILFIMQTSCTTALFTASCFKATHTSFSIVPCCQNSLENFSSLWCNNGFFFNRRSQDQVKGSYLINWMSWCYDVYKGLGHDNESIFNQSHL